MTKQAPKENRGLLINRFGNQDIQTQGKMIIIDQHGFPVFEFCSLELPWKNNQRRISCIPDGTYTVIKHVSPTFGECFWIQDVPGRSEILIHKGNFVGSDNPRTNKPDLLGCVAPGMEFKDITGDSIVEVVRSGDALDKLWEELPGSFDLTISSEFGCKIAA